MALSAKQLKIAYYLAQGLKPTQVAGICGVTPSYISQLVKPGEGPEGFMEEVNRLAAESAQQVQDGLDEEKDLDLKYLAAEHAALKAIEENLFGGEPALLNAQINALKAIADRQDKRIKRQQPQAAVHNGAQIGAMHITQILLPQHALQLPRIELNSSNQVIGINGQAMAPMASQQVQRLFRDAKSKETIGAEGAAAVQDFIEGRAEKKDNPQEKDRTQGQISGIIKAIETSPMEVHHEQATSPVIGSESLPPALPGPAAESLKKPQASQKPKKESAADFMARLRASRQSATESTPGILPADFADSEDF